MMSYAVRSSCDHEKFSQRYAVLCGSLILLVAVTLITTSCGTIAQASGSGGNGNLVLSPTLPGGPVDQPYNAVLSVSGGNSPYQFAVTSGTLPPGLSLNSRT